MKTIQKIFSPFMLTGVLLMSSSFYVVAQDINTGVFNTSQDYLKHHLTVYSEITLEQNGFKGVCDGKKNGCSI